MNVALDLADLSRFFAYDPETGRITRRVSAGCAKVGDAVGSLRNGYVTARHRGRQINGARLAWALHHGAWPTNCIDHINGVRNDNRIVNLRDVSIAINNQNHRRAARNNHLGVKGVKVIGKKFSARIRVKNETLYLGLYPTAEAAHQAYVKAKRIYHPGGTL